MEKSDIKSVSIIVGSCLACDGMVRIPASAKIHSIVRCPHCSESFPLQAILEQSVPELEIIGTSEQAPEEIIPHFDRVTVKKTEEDPPREKFVVPRQLTIGAKRKRRHRRRDRSSSEDSSRTGSSQGPFREQRLPSSRQATEAKGTNPAQDSDFSGIQPDTLDRNGSSSAANASNPSNPSNPNDGRTSLKTTAHSSQSRGRSKHRSRQESAPLKEILKVVVGGAMAFPIAYLMLFWFFKQDPLNLGPSISRVVPFVVPAELRDRSVDVESDSEKAKPERTIKSKKIETRETDESKRINELPIPDVDPDKILGNTDDLLID